MSHRFSIALGGISQTFYIRHNHQGELYILDSNLFIPSDTLCHFYTIYIITLHLFVAHL